jgi:hypothetical protein
MDEHEKFTHEVSQALLAPFEASQIKSRQQGGRQLPYVDSRTVQRRLDEAVGPGNWSFDYEILRLTEDHVAVKGVLTVFGVSKAEAGEQVGKEKQPGEERVKAAVSDAFKRSAVHFGCGRFLYHLDSGQPNPQQIVAAAKKAGWDELLACSRKSCGEIVDEEQADRTLAQFRKILCPIHEQQLADHLEAQRQEAQQNGQEPQQVAPAPPGEPTASPAPNGDVCAFCAAPVPPGQAKATTKLFGKPVCSADIQKAQREQSNKIAASPAV